MGAVSLDDILISQLPVLEIKNGNILKIMRKSDSGFSGFGESYFSTITYQSIKGWKLHKQMTMNLVVPVGKVKFVFCLDNDQCNKIFRIEEIGSSNYNRLTVPPGIWFGFQGLAEPNSLVLNISNIEHDENEVRRKNLMEFSFNW